jgi:tRNA wybutosine-synthesizing protein 3
MIKHSFQQRKKDVLSKLDKSSIGKWDKKIISLCEKINSLENYYTTSSCAGRVVIMLDNEKKGPELFISVYHDLISFKQLEKDFNKIKVEKLVKYKQEPCILHVACDTLEDAQKLLDKAKFAGWKKSGIIASGKRFVCELNSTERLEFPLFNNKRILVDDAFLKLAVKKSNENLKKSWLKINRLHKLI